MTAKRVFFEERFARSASAPTADSPRRTLAKRLLLVLLIAVPAFLVGAIATWAVYRQRNDGEPVAVEPRPERPAEPPGRLLAPGTIVILPAGAYLLRDIRDLEEMVKLFTAGDSHGISRLLESGRLIECVGPKGTECLVIEQAADNHWTRLRVLRGLSDSFRDEHLDRVNVGKDGWLTTESIPLAKQ